MLRAIALAAVLVLAACSTGTTRSDSQDVITCVNKQDRKLNFSYDPKNVEAWYSEKYNVNVYLITTTNGTQIGINSLELENYVCSGNGP